MKTKETKPKRHLIDRMSEAMTKGGIEHTVDELSDGSGMWISIRQGKLDFVLSFDGKGDIIGRVGLWEDIIQVVDQKGIFIVNGDKPTYKKT